MLLTLPVVGVVALGTLVVRVKRRRAQREMEQHSIGAKELHALLASDQEVLLFDVRQPLDLLAYLEMILRLNGSPQMKCSREADTDPKRQRRGCLLYLPGRQNQPNGECCVAHSR
jgi:hypothetical protein